MQIIITTTVRSSQPGEDTGHVYAVDLQRWEVTGRSPVPDPIHLKHDKNPRGGPRGGKGMVAEADRLWISNADHIRCYDPDWRLLHVFTHPSCAMIHDVTRSGDALWVASTCNDLLMKFDLQGALVDFFDPRCHENILKQSGLTDLRPWPRDDMLAGTVDYRDPRTHILEETDRLHLNAVCALPDGDLLISLGRVLSARMKWLWRMKVLAMRWGAWNTIVKVNKSISRLLGKGESRHTALVSSPGSYRAMVVRWTPGGAARVLRDLPGLVVPNHTLQILRDGRALYNDTDKGEVLLFDPDDGREISRIFVDRTFLRGAAQISDDHVVVGSQNYLYLLNVQSKAVERRLKLDENPRSAVHGIARLPYTARPLPALMETELAAAAAAS